jgi:hypothetical protein
MKKSVSYKVDVSLDNYQVIVAAQCECAVGQGPSAHCKHVACLLYAVHAFSNTGQLLTEQTCTQASALATSSTFVIVNVSCIYAICNPLYHNNLVGNFQ